MTQLADTSHSSPATQQRRQLARITGAAGLFTLVVVLGTSLANNYQSAPFDSSADETVTFFRSIDDALGAFSSFATAVGLIAMLWFTLGLALLLRRYDGELPWRSVFLAGAGVVSVVSGQIATWDAASYRSEDIDPQVARYAFDLGNLSFANGWVAAGAVGICTSLIVLSSRNLPHLAGLVGPHRRCRLGACASCLDRGLRVRSLHGVLDLGRGALRGAAVGPVRRRRSRAMTRAVELNGLTKAFGDVVAVDDVSAVASPGQVTALLGPNGAGKTTTLRTLLGLVAPTAGTATFDGLRYDELPEPVRQVGALLEASGCHPGRTALAHLHILATAARLPREAPERVLEETGLAGDARRRVGEYSLGMRQRLGLAAAMLGDPSVLVLDEPTNGLDPPGVRWLRGYLRRLADEGRTVLLSSHALSEVELTADHVLVLSHGRLVRSASLDVLRTEAGVGSRTNTPEPDRLCAVLDAAGHAYRHTEEELVVDAAPEQVGELAATHGIVLHALAGTGGLEQAFFHLIEQSDTAAQPAEVRS